MLERNTFKAYTDVIAQNLFGNVPKEKLTQFFEDNTNYYILTSNSDRKSFLKGRYKTKLNYYPQERRDTLKELVHEFRNDYVSLIETLAYYKGIAESDKIIVEALEREVYVDSEIIVSLLDEASLETDPQKIEYYEMLNTIENVSTYSSLNKRKNVFRNQLIRVAEYFDEQVAKNTDYTKAVYYLGTLARTLDRIKVYIGEAETINIFADLLENTKCTYSTLHIMNILLDYNEFSKDKLGVFEGILLKRKYAGKWDIDQTNRALLFMVQYSINRASNFENVVNVYIKEQIENVRMINWLDKWLRRKKKYKDFFTKALKYDDTFFFEIDITNFIRSFVF